MTTPLKIRDGHATINGDKTEYSMPSGSLDIIAGDGRTLFSISVTKDQRGVEVYAGGVIKVGTTKTLYADRVVVRPRSSNVVEILREEYK